VHMDILNIAKQVISVLRQIPNSTSDCEKIDDYISQLETQSVNLCVSGEFSSGKSSLINSLISYPLLPTADLPLTSKRIEIKHSDQLYLTCWLSKTVTREARQTVCRWLSSFEAGHVGKAGRRIRDRIRWDKDCTRMTYSPVDVVCIRNFLYWLECQKQYDLNSRKRDGNHKWASAFVAFIKLLWRKEKLLPFRKDEIEKIEIGLQLPDGLKSACILDIPGDGSIYAYNSNTKLATYTAQLVMHVLDAEHIGSKLTDAKLSECKDEATNIYVLNKIDTVGDTSLRDALLLLQERYQIVPVSVSALYENCACMLTHAVCSVTDLLNNPKVNLGPVVMSSEWKSDDLEANCSLVANYLHKASNASTLIDVVSSQLKQSQLRMGFVCCERMREILKLYAHKVDELIESITMPSRREKLLSEIDVVRALCSSIEEFNKSAYDNFNLEFVPQINAALNNLLKHLDKVLSNSLSLSFEQFEDRLQASVSSTFSFPVACEVKNVVETYFAQHKNKCVGYVSSNKLHIQFLPVTWDPKLDFLKLLQSSTCSAIGQILNDTSEKPWFSFARPRALDEYRRKQHHRCMRQWRSQMKLLLAEQGIQIVDAYKRLLLESLSPLRGLLVEKENNLKAAQSALSNMDKELQEDPEYLHLCEVQRELTKLTKTIDQEVNYEC